MPERRGMRWGWLVIGVIGAGLAYGAMTMGNRGAEPDETTADARPSTKAPANEPQEQSASAAPRTSPANVPAKRSTSSGDEIVLESKGYIIPAHKILVSPKVSGMLVSLNIEEGMRVTKGDVLGVIETIEYEADVHRAEAVLAMAEQRSLELERGSRPEEIEQARAELAEAQAMLAQLDADFQRSGRLAKIGGISQAELDAATASYNAQKRRIERLGAALALLEEGPRIERKRLAKAEIEQAKAELTKAKWRLENCTIRSPISGTILKKNAEEGNIVNPIAFNGSFSVCEMADLSDLEVELNIQERDVSRVFKGQRCKVRADAWSDRVYDGYVSRLMPIADRAKGAVPVRVKVSVPSEEEGVYLKPDMGAVVTFYARGTAEATAQAN